MMIACLALVLLGSGPTFERPTLSLDGQWEFALDPDRSGRVKGYPQGKEPLNGHIQVPGSWQGHGFGEKSGDPVLEHAYDGVAWYRREVTIPKEWAGFHVILHVEGVHRTAEIYVNGLKAGSDDGYQTPLDLDLTMSARPGEKNVLVMRVDGSEQPGNTSHGSFDGYRALHGVWGHVTLEAVAEGGVRSITATPDVAGHTVRLAIDLWGTTNAGDEMRIAVGASEKALKVPKGLTTGGLTLPIDDPHLWSPQDPHLYEAVTEIVRGGQVADRFTERFGMRSLEARDGKLLLNGKPVYLRGLVDACVFAASGFPSVDEASYLEHYATIKALGFNHVRCHSWCPPRAALRAADQLGLLLQCELPAAGDPDRDANTAALEGDWPQMVRWLWNHPSVAILSMGSELHGTITHPWHQSLYRMAQSLAPPYLVLDSSGDDTDDWRRPTQLVAAGQEGMVPQPSRYFAALAHELGTFNCLADLGDVGRFTGPYRPAWLERVRDAFQSHGAMSQYPQWLKCSRELQALARRDAIESARARRDLSGFSYALLVDRPGDPRGGAAATNAGLCDYAYQPRPEVDAKVFRRINEDTVVLARLPARVFSSMERSSTSVAVSHYGAAPMSDATLEVEFGGVVQKREHVTVAPGGLTDLGSYALVMPHVDAPIKMPLTVTLQCQDAFVRNSWDLWVFSSNESTSLEDGTLRWVSKLGEDDLRFLEAGGSVVLRDEERALPHRDTRFLPATGQGTMSLGTVIASHPALDGFPHDGFCSYPFAALIDRSGATLVMDDFDPDAVPIIRSIPDGVSTPWNMGFLYEWQVGKGRLLVTSFRFRTPEHDPAARELARRLSSYLLSDKLVPARKLPPEKARALARSSSGLARVLHAPTAPAALATYCGTASASLIRTSDEWQALDWESAPVAATPSRATASITLQLRGGVGQDEGEGSGSGGFTLEAAGQSLAFEPCTGPHTWKSESGKLTLTFEPQLVTRGSATGWFTLTLASNLVEAGKPLRLRARGSPGDGKRWFAVIP